MTSEIDFKSPCPVYECYKAGRKDVIYWIDSNCKHHYKLTRYGKLKCIGYNCYNNYESDLIGVKFNCKNHEIQRGSYQPNCNFQALINATYIATYINLSDREEADEFLEDLYESLIYQKKKYGFK